MRGYSEWAVVPMFDHDDYYKVGRNVVECGGLHWESKGKRFRDKVEAQKMATKLNEEMTWQR